MASFFYILWPEYTIFVKYCKHLILNFNTS